MTDATQQTADCSLALAFLLGFIPGAGYAYVGAWRLAAVSILTIHWFGFGFFFIGSIHAAQIVRRARAEVAGGE